MLLHLTAIQLDTPLPDEVLDQKCSWYSLIGVLGITLVIRIIGMDLAGALLTGLMLVFAVIIVRDNMEELQKYNLVFGLLCFVNFFFDILPLLSMLGGRRMEEIRPVPRVAVDDSGYHQEQTYSVTIKTYPFFDKTQGIVYNALSLSMVLSPIGMLLGAYLSFRAHDAIMRNTPALDLDDGAVRQHLEQPQDGGATDRRRGAGNGANGRAGADRLYRTFEPFHGTGHRLDGAGRPAGRPAPAEDG